MEYETHPVLVNFSFDLSFIGCTWQQDIHTQMLEAKMLDVSSFSSGNGFIPLIAMGIHCFVWIGGSRRKRGDTNWFASWWRASRFDSNTAIEQISKLLAVLVGGGSVAYEPCYFRVN